MFVLDRAGHPPVTILVGLSGGIQLSSLPGSRNIQEVMVAHDANGWKGAMDKEMATLRSHDV